MVKCIDQIGQCFAFFFTPHLQSLNILLWTLLCNVHPKKHIVGLPTNTPAPTLYWDKTIRFARLCSSARHKLQKVGSMLHQNIKADWGGPLVQESATCHLLYRTSGRQLQKHVRTRFLTWIYESSTPVMITLWWRSVQCLKHEQSLQRFVVFYKRDAMYVP